MIQSLFTIFDFFPKTKKNGTFRKSAHITLTSGGLDLKLFAFSKLGFRLTVRETKTLLRLKGMAQGCAEIQKLSFSDKTLTLSSAYWLNDFTLKHFAFSKLDSILFNRIKIFGMLHAIWWLECAEIDRNHEKPTTTPLSILKKKLI